ncbi:MAG: SDR family NAD(P)-dependent oxidoreductase [SAR324 cluster bacterium]|nr:SDR family NAD(P)-dependent oxidoreductase [SAR324 cluster bacterium]
MPSILVIGASRGIGLELVRQYLAAGWHVHATTRTPGKSLPLKGSLENLRMYTLDVRDSAQIRNLAEELSQSTFDVLIHNAAVHDGKEKEVMRINVEAPIELTEALLDNVSRSRQKKIVLMSSQMGARRGRSGKLDLYGESKARLNERFRELAPSLVKRNITAVVLHPGWVRTDMGGSSAPLSVAESVAGIKQVVENLNPQQHGSFLTWKGEIHPW